MTDTAPGTDRLIAALLGPPGPELSCEECFEQLDRYVDVALTGADPDEAVPGMRAHLIGCPACSDDHDSLLEYVKHPGPQVPPPAA
jgi:hypothetical protein